MTRQEALAVTLTINPRNYLEDVLPQLAAAHPDKVAKLAKTLTPTRWQAARALVGTAA